MQAQCITPRTLITQSGMPFPATITPQTDCNMMVTAICLYHHWAGRTAAYDTLETVMEAMRDGSAVVVLYIGADGAQAARVLWPHSITFTHDKQITARCYCTLRRAVQTFRLDRVHSCHALTTPADREDAA